MGLLLREQSRPAHPLSDQALQDLQLPEVLSAAAEPGLTPLTPHHLERYRTCDPEVIRWRQEVLADLLKAPELMDALVELYHRLDMWKFTFGKTHSSGIQDLPVVDGFLDTLFLVDGLLRDARPESAGLQELHRQLGTLIADHDLKAFARRWRKMAGGVSFPRRLDLLLNLDGQGAIVSMGLMGVSSDRFRPQSRFRRSSERTVTLSPPPQTPDRPPVIEDDKSVLALAIEKSAGQTIDMSVREAMLWLRRVTSIFYDIKEDILFYRTAWNLCRYWTDLGMEYAFAGICPENDSESARGLYHPLLPGRGPVVCNEWSCDTGGEIQMLTGANQGGKTTYLQSVGIAYWLFQLGWAVPAGEASLRPVDTIVTLFPASEQTIAAGGRFEQELRQLNNDIPSISGDTLVLFNEPFTSVSPDDALDLSLSFLCFLKLLGLRGLWVTHLHGLAAQSHLLNRELPSGCRLTCLVVGVDETGDGLTRPNYRIMRKDPRPTSHARDVLRRKGIDWV